MGGGLRDLRGRIGDLIYVVCLNVQRFVCTQIHCLRLRAAGVAFGERIGIVGWIILRRRRGSMIRIGDDVFLNSSSYYNLIGVDRNCSLSTLTPSARLLIGNNCRFSGTVIGAFDTVTIKDGVKCGANTLITDSDWHHDDPRSNGAAPVVIEENVWLGVNVVVLKGVTIGRNSVIGANSVVTKNIPENVIAAGNPCRVIKEITA